MPGHWRYGDTGTRLDRITALTDGVFAVAITLLVLDLKVPEIPQQLVTQELSHALRDLLPNFLSYTLSFIAIAIYWMGHHRCFTFIVRYDRTLVRLNLSFLFCISFIPFATAINGAYGSHRPAFIIYAVSVAITGLVFTLLWCHATTDHRLVDDALDARFIRYVIIRSLVVPCVALIGIGVSLIVPTYANVAWFAAPPLLMVIGLRYHREQAAADAAEFATPG
jgi:uncharacterized membrane protein